MKLGSHLDLVGSFTPSMRECDDEAIKRGRVFVDGDAAMVEAGELVGVSEENICGRLVNLISGDKIGRCSKEDITVFKSVGSAVVDLATAQFVYETFLHRNNNL
ncbi:hypothetical protein GIB67_037167 [Kingdonia uniflora]|uniref:Ornithine cyclodeaminase n=1 Tax=Kingdonia uniflora TaxID=39325 RepID=A0A7J7MRW3_9MAGN|nr:hypothetical protein GIB67_037167 [Kingdonia uniflora]